MITVNPSTGISQEVPETPIGTIGETIATLGQELRGWGDTSVAERVERIKRFLDTVAGSRDALIRTIADDMGKPFRGAGIEIDRALAEAAYLCQHAEAWLAPEPCPDGEIWYEPLGVVAVISPWNFPALLPLRGILPALLTGNGVVWKPSENALRTALLLTRLLTEAIQPEGAGALKLIVGGRDHGRVVVENRIAMVAFTGSTEVGRAIAATSGNHLLHLSLELGGLDAAIVCADADIPTAARAIVAANATNSGQVCNAVKRVFVAAEQQDAFIAAAVAASAALTLGAPESSSDLGPIVSEAQCQRIEMLVADAVARGGLVRTGGSRRAGPGFFFPHTVLTNVGPSARLWREEPFGPILPIDSFATVDEAIRRANETQFGLTASVWSRDIEHARSIARKLEVGTVSINSHAAGLPGAPWGGAKQSGLGRMKTKTGVHEFCNIKHVR